LHTQTIPSYWTMSVSYSLFSFFCLVFVFVHLIYYDFERINKKPEWDVGNSDGTISKSNEAITNESDEKKVKLNISNPSSVPKQG